MVRAYAMLSFLAILGIWLGAPDVLDTRDKIFWSGLLLGGLAPVLWLDTIRKFGSRSLRSIPLMIRIIALSRRAGLLGWIVFFCLCLWLNPMSLHPSPYRVHMSIALVAAIGFLLLQPPAVLMLGESCAATGRALSSVSNAAFPFRTVALLDQRRTGYILGSFSPVTDNLRTKSGSQWQEVADSLEDVAFLIVLDARSDSPAVAFEVGQIVARPDRLQRTLFIVGPNGESPALAAHGLASDSPGICSTNEQMLAGALRKAIRN